jgi:hypothetical protein
MDSPVMAARRARWEGVVVKVVKASWRAGLAVIPDCIFAGDRGGDCCRIDRVGRVEDGAWRLIGPWRFSPPKKILMRSLKTLITPNSHPRQPPQP